MSDLTDRLRKHKWAAHDGLRQEAADALDAKDAEIERLTEANDFNCKTLDEMEVLLLAEQARVEELESALRIFDPGMNSLDRIEQLEKQLHDCAEGSAMHVMKLEAGIERLQARVDVLEGVREAAKEIVDGPHQNWPKLRKAIAATSESHTKFGIKRGQNDSSENA